jgi:hypothetical protein
VAVTTRPATVAFTDAAAWAAVDAVIAAAEDLPGTTLDVDTARRVVDVALTATARALRELPHGADTAYFVIGDTHTGFPREGRDNAGNAYAICSSALLDTLRELADSQFRRRWDLGAPIGSADAVAQYTRHELPDGWPEHSAAPALARRVLEAATTAVLDALSGAGVDRDERQARRLVARALPTACAAMHRAGEWSQAAGAS